MRLWLITATDLRTREEVCCVYLWAMTNEAAEASLRMLFPDLSKHHTDYRALDHDEAVRVPHEAIGRMLTRSEVATAAAG
jgi:transposase InsO family protein